PKPDPSEPSGPSEPDPEPTPAPSTADPGPTTSEPSASSAHQPQSAESKRAQELAEREPSPQAGPA
ncbi:hypothetical protein P8605_21850, partial [Streptomyces sp. T-3]|nr:hypothetical protein [Streptomyces sp. T-3]